MKYIRTGKIKANKKKLRQKGYQFRDEDGNVNSESNRNNSMVASEISEAATETSKSDVNDIEVMSYFTLPAEYAFVARAISQMDGVGKSLDPDFDFISNAAPYIVEIKGTDLYLKDEAVKFLRSLQDRVNMFFEWLIQKVEELQAKQLGT
jgi:predicted unusual protein kinase regulating ubiquinone biosynthesis (AarF/ABC1/UbiB family)